MCHVADEQVGRLVETIQLDDHWLRKILDRISLSNGDGTGVLGSARG